jgi:hypothetical protein
MSPDKWGSTVYSIVDILDFSLLLWYKLKDFPYSLLDIRICCSICYRGRFRFDQTIAETRPVILGVKSRFKAPSLWILNVVTGTEFKISILLIKIFFVTISVDESGLKECLLIRSLRNSVSCLRKVPGSNFGQYKNCLYWGFSWFSSVFLGRYRGDISSGPRPLPPAQFPFFLFVNDIIRATTRTKQENRVWLTWPCSGRISLILVRRRHA